MYNEENNKKVSNEEKSITPISSSSDLGDSEEYKPNKGDPIDALKLSTYIQRKLYSEIFGGKTNIVSKSNILKSKWTGREYVPSMYLGYTNDLLNPKAYVGHRETPIDATYYEKNSPGGLSNNTGLPNINAIYNAAVYITQCFLCLGSYTFKEQRKTTGYGMKYDRQINVSGPALFSFAYTTEYFRESDIKEIRFENTIDNGLVSKGEAISTLSISNLIQSCYNSWYLNNKPFYTSSYEYCHRECHDSCHSDCHGDCDTSPGCHENDNSVICYHNADHYYGELVGTQNQCWTPDCHEQVKYECYEQESAI